MNQLTYFINDALVVTLDGPLDAKAVHELRPFLEELSDCGKDVVLDLSEVTFIDSSGIGAIVFLYKRLLMSNLRVNVVGLRPQPRELFLLLRIEQTILCHNSLKDYLQCQPALSLKAAM